MVKRRSGLLWTAMALALACTRDDQPAGVPGESADESARALLRRASLDLRGVRPTAAEYAELADGAPVDGMIAGFLEDPRFGERVRDLYAGVFRTRIDFYLSVDASPSEQTQALHVSVAEEVLRVVSYIAENDLPYTDLVLGDYTMADELLADLWPLDYPEGAKGWQLAHYVDGRPAAGVLASNSMWWRYPSNGSNYNRGRANAVSRIFLCSDIFARTVDFPADIDLSSEAAVRNAVREDQACLNCHASLDPLASYLFGFQYFDAAAVPAESARYHPEREQLWKQATGVAPGYFGEPGYSLRDLAHQLAGDPRFVDCAVETMYRALLGREVTIDDRDALNVHREVFLREDLRLRPLIASIMSDPRYRRTVPDEAGGVSGKLAGPELLASQLEDLTGYRLIVSGYDMLRLDSYGLRSLAGGADGATGAGAASEPSATLALVHQRVAEGAAAHAVAQDAAASAGKRVWMVAVDPDDPKPSEPAIRAQLVAFHLRLHGVAPPDDDPEIDELVEVWREVLAVEGEPRLAWGGALSVLLRDPELLYY